MTNPRSVLVLGATGLVGGALVNFLLRDPSVLSIVALVRQSSGLPHDPKLRVLIADFDRLRQHTDAFQVHQIYCALGTTMRQAGTQVRFRLVDHDYPVTAAHIGRAQGATHYLLVSALGANASSRIFYNRVKGETERDIVQVGFPSVTIARPSLLVGPRAQSRLAERVGAVLARLAPPAVRPIPAQDVAAALTLAGRESRPGVQILRSREMLSATTRL
ncbi:MAG: NAD(P)H-binding protein [Gemmatimonadaceae bacterium]